MDQTSETEKVYQRNKYNEIIEMLLTAGYFRARINTLSEFDKVVGGLCWCITSSGELVDVDILFQENTTTGQKIALSESIVKALVKMGCPTKLQPHQIQGGVGGSDYPAIHAATVWLIKKYFERRGEREEQLRNISTFQFSKNYQLPSEECTGLSVNLARILDRNKATRSFKSDKTVNASEETRVRACLLEFGESFAAKKTGGNDPAAAGSKGTASDSGKPVSLAEGIAKAAAAQQSRSEGGSDRVALQTLSSSVVSTSIAGLSKLDITELSAFEKQLAKAAKEAAREEQAFAEHASKEEQELMKHMSQIDGAAEGVVSGSQVGSIVGMGSNEMGSALAAYQAEVEEAKRQMDSNLASGKLGQAAAFTRQRQNLTRQLGEVSARGIELKVAGDALAEKMRVIEEERDEAAGHIEQLKDVLKKLAHMESSAMQQDDLSMLKSLVSLNESLKAQEAAFKGSCKAQMQDYNARIKAFDAGADDNVEENKKLNDIEDMHAKVIHRLSLCFQFVVSLKCFVMWSVVLLRFSDFGKAYEAKTALS
jgi:hypothetical protein